MLCVDRLSANAGWPNVRRQAKHYKNETEMYSMERGTESREQDGAAGSISGRTERYGYELLP